MKKTEIEALRKMDIKALNQKARDLRGQIADLIMDRNTSKLSDKKAVVKKRRERAVILTILGQKQMVSQLESEKGGNP